MPSKISGKNFASNFFGDSYQRHVQELTTQGTIDGHPLSAAERKEGFKKRNDKIDFNKFVDKFLGKKTVPSGGSRGTPTANPGSFGGIVKSDPGKMVAYDPLIAINNALDNILQVLRNEAKAEEKHKNWLQRLMETYRRRKKEDKLEFKILRGITATAKKVLEPFKSAWQKLWDFISTVLLGRILFKLVEWLGDKENQGKIKAIFGFLKNTWPTLLAAYLLFGNSFTKFIAGMMIKVGVWTVKIVSQLIPQLVAALAKLKGGKLLKMLGGKKAMRAMQLTGLAVGAYQLHGRMTDGGEPEPDTKQPDTKQPDTKQPDTKEMKTGGFVSGPFGTDRVPAKLTAGEFVMSTGAVEKFGVGTMEAMNAAGGGTNRPLGGRYNTGGRVSDKGNEPSAIAGIAEGVPYTFEQELQTMIIRHKHRTEELNEAIQSGQGVDSTKRRHSRATRGLIKYTNNNPKVVANLSVVDKKYIDLLVNSDKKDLDLSKIQIPSETSQETTNIEKVAPSSIPASATEKVIREQRSTPTRGGGRFSSSKKSPSITPPVKMKSTQAYQKELKKADAKPDISNAKNEIPSFSPTAMRSPQKIAVLGISV